ncbi:MAG: hypothetical protein NW224_11280 [Leptolyngbyaceae cyanobacterium bins.302]|nr:hypothetical protein [Leptolyngbyaceae cyanobacterium bins.302]
MASIERISLPLIAPIDSPWNLVVYLLTDPQLCDGSSHADEKTRLIHRAYALAEMIRLKWAPKNFKELRTRCIEIKAEGFLWWRVLELIDATFLVRPSGYKHPALWFVQVVLEERLSGMFRLLEGEGKADINKRLQRENQCLLEKINPFDPQETPHTWMLIDVAAGVAERSVKISKEQYTPMVKARIALTTILIEEGAVRSHTGTGFRIKRQGRKKEK